MVILFGYFIHERNKDENEKILILEPHQFMEVFYHHPPSVLSLSLVDTGLGVRTDE